MTAIKPESPEVAFQDWLGSLPSHLDATGAKVEKAWLDEIKRDEDDDEPDEIKTSEDDDGPDED